MAAQNPFIAYVLELLAPSGNAAARRMFGGYGIYLDGVMVGLVSADTFYLKTDAITRSDFEAAGSVPFVFEAKKRAKTIATGYLSAPEHALDSSDAMRPWARLALQAALRKAATKPKRKSAPAS